jgi:DNA-binding HxlR family transcriptional regulator
MIPRASKKGLTSSLRLLEAAKVIVRKDLSQSVLHVEYEIADTARARVISLMRCLADWGEILLGSDGSECNSI